MTSDSEAAGTTAGTVARLWRYPVKSMRGERVGSAAVDERGLVGDRLFAVWDAEGKFGSCKNTNRFRRMDGLLEFAASYLDDPVKPADCAPELVAPDGARHAVPSAAADAAVRAYLSRDDVQIVAEAEIKHHDSSPLHLVSQASLDWFDEALEDAASDERRLRPNLVLAVPGGPAFVEDGWVGRRLRIGGADGVVIEVTGLMERCRTVNVEQHDLPYTSRGLKVLAGRDLNLGVKASVIVGGRMCVGDPVVFVD